MAKNIYRLRTEHRYAYRIVLPAWERGNHHSYLVWRERKQDIEEWCYENCTSEWSYSGNTFWFEDAREAMMAKLVCF